MRNTRIWVATAVAANLLLLAALLATPTEVRADGTTFPWPWGDCCKESVEEMEICCDNCCWFTNNCNSSTDCGAPN